MAAHYTVLSSGLLGDSKLVRTYEGAILSTVVASGGHADLKAIAEKLNEAEAANPSPTPTK
jgi:hypothetical protein